MDPGRLLHGFICRGNANLDGGQILMLMPGSPAESLLTWLEGLPGTSHKIVKWQNLDITSFEKSISKSLRKKIGQYPLPTQFAIRDPQASTRSTFTPTRSSPSVLEHPNTVSPPPYTNGARERGNDPLRPPVAELGLPEVQEMAASPIAGHSTAQRSATMNIPPSALGTSHGSKSIHTLRRKAASTPAAILKDTSTAASTERPISYAPRSATPPSVSELPSNPAVAEAPSGDGVERPTELPSQLQDDVSKPDSLIVQVAAPTDDQTKSIEVHQKAFAAPEVALQSTSASVVTKDGETIAGGSATSTLINDEPKDDAVPNIVVTTSSPEVESTDPIAGPEKVTIVETQATGPEDSLKGEQATNDLAAAEPSETVEASSSNSSNMNPYLELLNKVAKGEISPQALGEMLQKSGISQT
jgi:hypothetical protein